MSQKLTIIQMNDSHAYLEPHTELFWHGSQEVYRSAGGFAHIAGYLNKVRQENTTTVVLDNGDTLHGTYAAVSSRGKDMVPVLNMMEFDAMTAHWEFAYGPNQLKVLTERLTYPCLAVNCYSQQTDHLLFQPYHVIERDGLRIGVLGIAATIVDKTMPGFFSEGVKFTLGAREARYYTQHLRDHENVDVVIALSHLGYPQDIELLGEVKGIDVMLSGHTHNRLYQVHQVDKTIVMQSGAHGSFVGRLDMIIDQGRITSFSHQLVPINATTPQDKDVAALIEETMAPHRDMLQETVGRTTSGLHRYQVMETSMDTLLLHALQATSGSPIAFSNGWRYGAPIPPGPITMNDLWNIIPTNPPISICDITGEDMLAMLEENLERTFSRNPYRQMGGYVKRCGGLTVYLKVENPPGQRIQECYVGTDRLQPTKVYTACYVTAQGVPKQYGTNRRDLDITAVDALAAYIRHHSPVSIHLEQSVRPV